MNWTPEKEKKLRELWKKGHSASQIASMLEGRTRNAVIGKAHRLKLAARAASKGSKIPKKQVSGKIQDGTDIWNASNRRLAKGARYGICGVTSGYKAELQMGAMFTGHLTMFGVYMGRSEDLEQIIYHAGQGTLKGVIDSEYSLEDARKAHEDMERLEFFGKLVITVD